MSSLMALIGGSSGAGRKVTEFKSSGVFIVPSGLEVVQVLLVGGGGSGGTGNYAGGGGGGEVVFGTVSVKGLTTIPVTIGAGGGGAIYTTGPNVTNTGGKSGSKSTFGTLLTAFPGGRGGGGPNTPPKYGGAGGGRHISNPTRDTPNYVESRSTGGRPGAPQVTYRNGGAGMVAGSDFLCSYGGGGGGTALGGGTKYGGYGGTSYFGPGGRPVDSSGLSGGGASYGDGTDASTTSSLSAGANTGAGSGAGKQASGNGGSGYCLVFH